MWPVVFWFAAAAGDRKFVQQLRHTDIADFLKTAAGGISQRAGNICLAIARGTFQNDMVSLINVPASGQTEHLGLVQLAVLVVFNTFDRRRRRTEMSLFDQTVNLVGLPPVPFSGYRHTEPFFETERIE